MPSLPEVVLALVHSNVFIALAATSWVVTTTVLVGLPFDPVPAFIVFAVTLFVYSFNRFTDIDEDEYNVPGRAAFTRRYGRIVLGVGTVSYAIVVGLAFELGLPRAELLFAPLAIALLYSVGGLKRILLVKNLLVGVAWGAIPFGVGVYHGVADSTDVLFLAAYVTVMLTVAAVIFDLKDVEGDRREGIRTIPLVFGPRGTRLGSMGVSGLAAASIVAAVGSGALAGSYLVLLAFNAYVCWYSLAAEPDAGPLFYGFVVDGEHAFLALVVLALYALDAL
nr:UbiA family prenyltransferase [Halovivax sp.]